VRKEEKRKDKKRKMIDVEETLTQATQVALHHQVIVVLLGVDLMEVVHQVVDHQIVGNQYKNSNKLIIK
jgi:hypothetical protein